MLVVQIDVTGSTVLLLASGVVAGMVGTAGGITSLVSYPALLLAGLPVLGADIANVVALVVCWPGSALASTQELAGQKGWLIRWAPICAAGGAAGALLLRLTPPGAFGRIVPFLVVVSALAMLAQPRLSRLLGPQVGRRSGLLAGGLFSVSIYNGYFGAGAGVMTLVILLVSLDSHLPRANALKNMLIGAATISSAVLLAATGPVRWSAVVPLAVGLFAGSLLGPVVARRLPPGVLRVLIALAAMALSISLWAGVN